MDQMMIYNMARNGVGRGLTRTGLIPKLVDWPTVSADPTPTPDDHTLDELFEERAAIRQFDGKLSRIDAEILAARDVSAELDRFSKPPISP